jgi:hypothetical protein
VRQQSFGFDGKGFPPVARAGAAQNLQDAQISISDLKKPNRHA